MADVAVLPPAVAPPREKSSKKHHKRRVVAIRPDGINPAAFEHRHFLPLHPTCNKLIAKRWEDYVRDIHHERLKQAKPTIDDSKPRVFRHLDMRLKKQQMEEERVHEIEKHNNILFHRIMHQKIGHTEISDISKIKEYIENRNHIAESHQHFRNRNNEQIFKENLTILQRIEEKAPNYNRLDWHSARFRNLGYLCNIAQYPKHYWDLLIEGKDNYDLVRPRTHHSPRVEAIARRASQVKTAPERLGRELRPKTRGAPISSPLPEADDTAPLGSKPASKPSSLKNLVFSQQVSVKSEVEIVPLAAEPTESVARIVTGSASVLQQSTTHSVKGSVTALQQPSTRSVKAITSEMQQPSTNHITKGSIAGLHNASVKGSTSFLATTQSKKASINNLSSSSTASLGKSSKKPSKAFLNDASNYTLSDNRSIKLKEDEESAKAAIVIPDRDDLADLGIVDYNSNGTGEEEGGQKVESRPSSGWSEFADASPYETSESVPPDERGVVATNEEAQIPNWTADDSEVVRDSVAGTFEENVIDENGYAQEDGFGQILEPTESGAVEETREYVDQPASFEAETQAEVDEVAAAIHNQDTDYTDTVESQLQHDAEYEVEHIVSEHGIVATTTAAESTTNEDAYAAEKQSAEIFQETNVVIPPQNDDYEIPAAENSYAMGEIHHESEEKEVDAAAESTFTRNENTTPAGEDSDATHDLETSTEEAEAAIDLKTDGDETPAVENSYADGVAEIPDEENSHTDHMDDIEEPLQSAEVDVDGSTPQNAYAVEVPESTLEPSQTAEVAVDAPSQKSNKETFDEPTMNEILLDAKVEKVVEPIENTAEELNIKENVVEGDEHVQSWQTEELAHPEDEEVSYAKDSEPFETAEQAENVNAPLVYEVSENNTHAETVEKSAYDEEFETPLQDESKLEKKITNAVENIPAEPSEDVEPQHEKVEPEAIAATDDDVPLGVIYSEKQAEIEEAPSEAVLQEPLDESEDSQFKRPAPLPPIESSGKRPSSSSTSGNEILSLSRPISAKVLGPIATPPRNSSKPPSQPPSRPMSGFVAEGPNSKRTSLPALVKTLSSPSSRPLSGIRPLLSKPGFNQNAEEAVAAEVGLLTAKNGDNEDFDEAVTSQHLSRLQTPEKSPSTANLVESDGDVPVKTGSALNLVESEVLKSHSQTPGKAKSVVTLLNENVTQSKNGSASRTPVKSPSAMKLINSEAQKPSASQTPAKTRSAANLIDSDFKSKKTSKNQTPIKVASVSRLIDLDKQKSTFKSQTPAKAGSVANVINSEVKSNAHSKRQTPAKAQSVVQLIDSESHKASAPQTPIPKRQKASAAQTPVKSMSAANLIGGENTEASASQTPTKENSAANLIDTEVFESSPPVISESVSHLVDSGTKPSTVPQTPTKVVSVAHLVESKKVKSSSRPQTPAKAASVAQLIDSKLPPSTSQTSVKSNSAVNLIESEIIKKRSKSKLIGSETSENAINGTDEVGELPADEEYVRSHTTLLKNSSKPQSSSNLLDTDAVHKSRATLQEATKSNATSKNSTTHLGEISKHQSAQLAEGDLTPKTPSSPVSRSSSSKARTPSKQRSARLSQAASQASLKMGKSGASLADLVPLK
ncbi:UNVERIFIED_CONTAM: hypothetical protein HDU68_011413 [Siphonaria sp. JEL0065]|nr:hypothetical protein HDU68_011413 [Siphonaria sp. JEL0065]